MRIANADTSLNQTSPIPEIDISPFTSRTSSQAEKDAVVAAVRKACLEKGFLTIVGHSVSTDLQMKVLDECAAFFDLPQEEKEKLAKSKSYGNSNRGYEKLYEQVLSKEAGALPDAKESYLLGMELPMTNSNVVAKRINFGPNLYPPSELVPNFQAVLLNYHNELYTLSRTILRILALTLSLPENFFETAASQNYATTREDTIATLRLLHYPPVETKGYACGAHTDFGAVTILLQDHIGGLEVWDHDKEAFMDVPPPMKRTNASDEAYPYVVNLGDAMARWTNDLYRSTLHRVILKETGDTPKHRYSVPFFFNGNVDTRMAPLDGAEPKYPIITIEEHLTERYKKTAAPKS